MTRNGLRPVIPALTCWGLMREVAMLLIDGASLTVQKGLIEERPQCQVRITHQVERQGKDHVLRIFQKDETHGPLGGKLLALITLDAEQAKELKAHL